MTKNDGEKACSFCRERVRASVFSQGVRGAAIALTARCSVKLLKGFELFIEILGGAALCGNFTPLALYLLCKAMPWYQHWMQTQCDGHLFSKSYELHEANTAGRVSTREKTLHNAEACEVVK